MSLNEALRDDDEGDVMDAGAMCGDENDDVEGNEYDEDEEGTEEDEDENEKEEEGLAARWARRWWGCSSSAKLKVGS